MRTIKFRGKCVHDSKYAGEWVTGGYVAPEADAKKQDEGLIICYFGGNATLTYHVMPETVGQFTGLQDKNGKDIYEGDLLRYGERNYVVSYEDSHKGAFSLIRNNTFVGCFGEHTNIFWYLDGIAYHNVNMTISPKSARYKHNVGGAKFLQENKERAEKVELRQFRYIKFLDKTWKKKCLLKELPYPKYYLKN